MAPHIGDATIDKYKSVLSEEQQCQIALATKTLCWELGYVVAPSLPVSGTLEFRVGAKDVMYLISGFSSPEKWGVWNDSESALNCLPLVAAPQEYFRVRLEFLPFTYESSPTELVFFISVGPP